MKKIFLLSALLLGTLITWADDYSAIVYPDCSKDTIIDSVAVEHKGIKAWMSYFDDDVPLFDLTIPGLHEACTWFYSGNVSESYIKDQVLDYKDSWDLGARAFDLRLAFEELYIMDPDKADYSKSTFHHGDKAIAAELGVGAMNTIEDDVANHFPTIEQLGEECMILFAKIEFMGDIIVPSPTGSQDLHYCSDTLKVFNCLMTNLVNKYGADRFIAYYPGMTLGEARGKIIMFVRNKEYTRPYSSISGTHQVPINYLTDMCDNWDINTCINTPIEVKVYENGVETASYNNTYTQDIYQIADSDQDCYKRMPHKPEAIVAMAKKEPNGALCVNGFNGYCKNIIGLPCLWDLTPMIHDSILHAINRGLGNFKGVNLMDFFGVLQYDDIFFHGNDLAYGLLQLNFGRAPKREIALNVSADGCENANKYIYDGSAMINITAEHQNGRYFSQWSDDNLDNPRSIWVSKDTTFTAWYNHVRLFSDDSKNGITYNFTGRDCSTDDCSDAKTVTLATSFGSSTNTILFVDDTITATIDFTVPETTISTHYGGWDDGVWGGHRVFTAYSDTTFTAIFGDNIADVCFNDWHHYNFTNDSLGLGSYIEYAVVGTGQGSIAYFADSAIITAKARPSRGVHFDHWEDNDSTDPIRTDLFTKKYDQIGVYFSENKVHTSRVCLSADTTINFTDPTCDQPNLCQTHTLTLNTTYCDRNTYVQFTDSDDIKLYADETDEYRFYQWSDGNTDNPRTVSVGSDTTFTAVYAYQVPIYSDCAQDTLTINYIGRDGAHSEGGDTRTITLYCDSCDNAQHVTVQVHDGDVVVLDPVNDPAYHFVCWNDSVPDNPRIMTATSDMTYTATFAENAITYYQSGNQNPSVYDFTGNRPNSKHYTRITGASDGWIDTIYIYDQTDVKITVVPDSGIAFAGWTDGNLDNPRTITLSGNREDICAVFSNNNVYIYQDCDKNGRTFQFTPSQPMTHDYVDLGFGSGLLWSPTNLGANAPEEYGDSYAWGDTNPNPSGKKEDYIWADGNGMLTRYCTDSQYGKVDGATELADMDDVVKNKWGQGWRMPTKAELQELLDNCDWQKDQVHYENSVRIGTGPNGATITFPLTLEQDAKYNAAYYSASDKQGTITDWYNWALYFSDWPRADHDYLITENYRYAGGAIRPVHDRLNPVSTGSVYVDGCETASTIIAQPNEQVCLVAIPQPGYHFLQWSDGVTHNPRQMTLTDGMSATAQFAADNQIFWDCNRNGNHYDYHRAEADAVTLTLRTDSCEQANEYVLNQGDSICITAVVPNGVRFVQWSDSVTDNPRWIRLNSDTTFSAQFELLSPDIFISSDDSKNGQEYNYYTNREAGHEYVDLGLPSGKKWATTSVGATSPEQLGNAYAWAEVEAKGSYSWVNYMWAYKTKDKLTKYYDVDGDTILTQDDDAAHANWGGAWHMPNYDEVQELLNNCTVTEDSLNGVAGYYFTGKNNNRMFVPATPTDEVGTRHLFWTTVLLSYAEHGSHSIYYTTGRTAGMSGKESVVSGTSRSNGVPVRALCQANPHYRTISLKKANAGDDKVNTFHIDDDIPCVYIRAIVEDGYRFVQWSDSVTDNPRILKIDDDIDLTAEFAKNEIIVSQNCDDTTVVHLPAIDCSTGDCNNLKTLTIQVAGCERVDTIHFADTLITTLTAAAEEGYVFTGWSDGNADSSRIVTLSSDTALTATFYQSITDTIYQDCSLNGATYDYRTTETDTRRILLYADSCAAADTVLVNFGAVLTTTAVAEAGYYFARWSDGVSVNPRVDTITTDTILRAEFLHARNIPVYFDCAQNDSVFDLHTSNQDVDTIRLSVDSCDVSSMVLLNRGSSFVVEALAPRGYQLAQWTDNVTDNPRTIIANGNATYLGQYKRLEMPIYSNCQDYQTIYHFGPDSCNNGGDCNMRLAKINAQCSDPYQFDFADSISVYLLPQISIDKHFEQWEDGCRDNPRLVTVNTDTTFSISFVSNKIELYRDNRKNVDTIYDFTNHTLADSTHIHTLTVRCKDTDIALLARFTDSCQVDLSAIPCMGYRFVQWSDGDTLAARTETIYGDTTFTAEFEMVTIDIAQSCGYNNGYCDYSSSDQDIVTVLLSADGCESMDTVLINSGGQMSISASANVNNRFLQWSDGNTDNPRVFVPTTDTTLLAKFCDFISITITADSVEKITGVPDTTLTWQITHGYPDKGDTIVGVSLTRDQGEDPGVYTIHVEVADSLNPKYNITTQDGHMRIYDGEHRMPKDATKTTIGYESEHWYNRENGIYYTDGYMNEMIADSVPLTTYLMYDDIRHDCRKFDFQSYYDLFGHTFSYIAVTTYEDDNDTDTKWAEFSVAHPNVSNARLLWYKNWADPNYGQFNINVLLNDTTVFYIHQDYQLLGGFNAVYFSALKQNDIVRFQVERPNPAQWGATVTVAAVLQYTHPDGDITRIESVNADGSRQGVKFIRDGQFFILRAGRVYNAQGVLVY